MIKYPRTSWLILTFLVSIYVETWLSFDLRIQRTFDSMFFGRIEESTMTQTMEDYHQSNDHNDDQRSWFWSKAISVGKKVLTVGVVVSSAPFFVPPLVIVSTIAFVSSVPFCLFLANYACTQKLMSSLLPSSDEVSGTDEEESEFEYSKLGLGEGSDKVGEAELFRTTYEEDEEMAKESTSLIEKIRDEGRNVRGTSEKELQDSEKSKNAKSEKVQDQPEKQEETGHEGEDEASTTETSTSKVYSEEQIWEKMKALRKIVGYSVARSATFAEELKALYVFTGVVEPTQSSLNRDTHDIAEVTHRLRFLMSVVGIN